MMCMSPGAMVATAPAASGSVARALIRAMPSSPVSTECIMAAFAIGALTASRVSAGSAFIVRYTAPGREASMLARAHGAVTVTSANAGVANSVAAIRTVRIINFSFLSLCE